MNFKTLFIFAFIVEIIDFSVLFIESLIRKRKSKTSSEKSEIFFDKISLVSVLLCLNLTITGILIPSFYWIPLIIGATGLGNFRFKIPAFFVLSFLFGFMIPPTLFGDFAPPFLNQLASGGLVYLLFRFFSFLKKEPTLLQIQMIPLSLGVMLLYLLKQFSLMSGVGIALAVFLTYFNFRKRTEKAYEIDEKSYDGLAFAVSSLSVLVLTSPKTEILLGFTFIFPLCETIYFLFKKHFFISTLFQKYPTISKGIRTFLLKRQNILILLGVLYIIAPSPYVIPAGLFVLFEMYYTLQNPTQEKTTLTSLFKQMKTDFIQYKKTGFKESETQKSKNE